MRKEPVSGHRIAQPVGDAACSSSRTLIEWDSPLSFVSLTGIATSTLIPPDSTFASNSACLGTGIEEIPFLDFEFCSGVQMDATSEGATFTSDRSDGTNAATWVLSVPGLANASMCEVQDNTMSVEPTVLFNIITDPNSGAPAGVVTINLPIRKTVTVGDSFKLRCYTLVSVQVLVCVSLVCVLWGEWRLVA